MSEDLNELTPGGKKETPGTMRDLSAAMVAECARAGSMDHLESRDKMSVFKSWVSGRHAGCAGIIGFIAMVSRALVLSVCTSGAMMVSSVFALPSVGIVCEVLAKETRVCTVSRAFLRPGGHSN